MTQPRLRPEATTLPLQPGTCYMSSTETPSSFDELGLSAPVLQAVAQMGYETPSPIQSAAIPHLLKGEDIIGQAQTGTGKTGAFALPLLSNLDLSQKNPQILVLAPTRELAIQVAEAFQAYARTLKGFHVLPIYGGQSYDIQLRQLRRGVHVVVGTPGRVMDHIRRKTLNLSSLKTLVLDEADEMLRMGFIDDVEWILEQLPAKRQVALFSATMPPVIRKVADRYLNSPAEIKIKSKTETATTIRQRYWLVSGLHKLDAMTRILETEPLDAAIIFVRTKNSTVDLAERLSARGYACEALNGDIPQNQRERIVDRLKKGSLDLLVATDVVARGLDVERISHVINFDIPHDIESYVHRIGRTGRAGRTGDAILFVAPRERRLLKAIERHTKQPIEPMDMPSVADINVYRIARFKDRIAQAIAGEDLDTFTALVSEYQQEHDEDPIKIAAALALMAQGKEPLLLKDRPARTDRTPDRSTSRRPERERFSPDRSTDRRAERKPRNRPERDPSRTPYTDDHKTQDLRRDPHQKVSRPGAEPAIDPNPKPLKGAPDIEMKRYRIEVGLEHDVKPGNIVGAIANEADIESRYIGHIELHDSFSTVDLPDGMPKEVMHKLQKAFVCGRRLELKDINARTPRAPKSGQRPPANRGKQDEHRGNQRPRAQGHKGPQGQHAEAGHHSPRRKKPDHGHPKQEHRRPTPRKKLHLENTNNKRKPIKKFKANPPG